MRCLALVIAIVLPAFSAAALAQDCLSNPCIDPPANRSPSPVERALSNPTRRLSLPLVMQTDAERQAAADAETAWQNLPYAERVRRFQTEGRDDEWATSMERAIRAEIAGWNRPPVQLADVECRVTMCRISMIWPRSSGNPEMGMQASALYGLGIDHQGETDLADQGIRYLWTLIARRR